ncbi:MAG: hypothetical protein JWQ98_592 [Chlorobi bacterium]|nr:hypothetical protein [Chlorobiota bacterium]
MMSAEGRINITIDQPKLWQGEIDPDISIRVVGRDFDIGVRWRTHVYRQVGIYRIEASRWDGTYTMTRDEAIEEGRRIAALLVMIHTETDGTA